MERLAFIFLIWVFSLQAWAPDFIVIGAQKAGTTALYDALKCHPQIKPARTKEVHYFDVNYQKGINYYKKYFPEKLGPSMCTGEASPYYIVHPLAPSRIKNDCPDTKIIVLLRNPVSRAYSQYQMNKRCKVESRSMTFEKAIEIEPLRLDGESEKIENGQFYNSNTHRRYSYLTRSRYAEQLTRWFEHFPREQIHIVFFEDFVKDNVKVANQVYAFLGLAPHYFSEKQVPNKKHHYAPMNQSTREKLTAYFEPYNQELEELLGVTLPW